VPAVALLMTYRRLYEGGAAREESQDDARCVHTQSTLPHLYYSKILLATVKSDSTPKGILKCACLALALNYYHHWTHKGCEVLIYSLEKACVYMF
jgi:hypothetical protein